MTTCAGAGSGRGTRTGARSRIGVSAGRAGASLLRLPGAGADCVGGVANNYETLKVHGSLYIRGGSLFVHVDGNTNGQCDQIVATGDVEINDQKGNSAMLTVTTDNRNPPTGNKYDILQGSTMGANDFAGFTWLGEKTTAYTHTPNVQGANGKVYELQS
jgi:hypothetical protein